MVLLQQTSTQTNTGPLILQREKVQDLQGYYYAIFDFMLTVFSHFVGFSSVLEYPLFVPERAENLKRGSQPENFLGFPVSC